MSEHLHVYLRKLRLHVYIVYHPPKLYDFYKK